MTRALLSVVLLAAAVHCCVAQEKPSEVKSATLSGQFLFDGEPPALRAFAPKPGVVVVDDSLLVDKKSRGISNVVVTLYRKAGEMAPIPIYPPGFAPMAETTLTARQRFEPHVLLVRTDQKLNFANSDPSGLDHNFKVDLIANPVIDILVPESSRRQMEFSHSEKLPAPVHDSKFPWMRAYLVVTDHPFVAVSDAQGKFTMDYLPPGEWTFRAWQEAAGFVEKVECKSATGPWKRGQFTIQIKPGENDLGAIKVSPGNWR